MMSLQRTSRLLLRCSVNNLIRAGTDYHRRQRSVLSLSQEQPARRSGCPPERFLSFTSASSSSPSSSDPLDLSSMSIPHFLALRDFKPTPPTELTQDVVEGVVDTVGFYIKNGVSNQQCLALAAMRDIPPAIKWQKMLQVYLSAQLQVVAGLGYSVDENGMNQFAMDLSRAIERMDETSRQVIAEIRKSTWRELVSTCFEVDIKDIPTLSIVDARNVMHKVSSKMMEPSILDRVEKEVSKIQETDPKQLVARKHLVLQIVIVENVFMGGSPSLVEESGCGPGPQGYAKLQCALTDHEGDPLINQYAAAGMARMWDAAGLFNASEDDLVDNENDKDDKKTS